MLDSANRAKIAESSANRLIYLIKDSLKSVL